MFKKLVFFISISLTAMPASHCGDPMDQKTKTGNKPGQMELVKSACTIYNKFIH